MKLKRAELALAIGLVLTILFTSFCSFANECDTIREDVIRLHVKANSDSDEDQALKLKVRNRVLSETKEIFLTAYDKADAAQKVKENLPGIEAAAREVIREEGYAYPVSVSFANEYFTTRDYETFTLPAGSYDAVRVNIGQAKGQNWWCVMFPPMCLPAAGSEEKVESVIGKDGVELIGNKPKYEVKFKVVEWLEGFGAWISGSDK